MATVEMRPAYQWTCDECGHEQFEAGIIEEMSMEERLEHLKKLGVVEEFAEEIPEDVEGEFMYFAEEVTCAECGSVYETKHYSEMDDE